jgi:hypothetical protein
VALRKGIAIVFHLRTEESINKPLEYTFPCFLHVKTVSSIIMTGTGKYQLFHNDSLRSICQTPADVTCQTPLKETAGGDYCFFEAA